MDDFITVAIVLFGAVAVFLAVRILSVFVAILRITFWPVKMTPLIWQPELAPDEQVAVNELALLGFTPVAADRFEMGPLNYNAILFQNAEREAFALLSFHAVMNNGYFVEFFSFTADGRTLLTQNRLLPIGALPDVTVAHAYADSLAGHWECHMQRMNQEALVCPAVEEANRLTIARAENLLPLLLKSKAVVIGRDGAWHPSIRSALGMSWAWWKARSKLAKPYQSALTMGPHRSMFFARTYEQAEALTAARPPRHNVTAAIMIITLAVSLAFWGSAFTWEYAAIITAVLLVHEGGHAIAMRAFGYRDINMFFIPFFGAAVTGTAKEMPAWKQAIVLLAGPLPGLLAALSFFIFRGLYQFETGSVDFGRIAAVAGVVNLFNLLPVTPLDGGQLLEISVFSRWPRVRLAFAGSSAAAFSVLAAWSEDRYLMPIVVFFWISLIGQWRVTDLQRAWKEGLDPREQLLHLFDAARKIFGPQPFARHYGLVKAVFKRRKIQQPRIWESVFGLSIMLAVWGGVGTAAIELRPQQQQAAAAAPIDNRTFPQKEFDKAFYALTEGESTPILAVIEELGGKLDAADPRLTDLAVLKALALPIQDRLDRLELLIEQRREGNFYKISQIAGALLSSVRQDSEKKPRDEQIASLRGGLERVSRVWSGNFQSTSYFRVKLAEMIATNGNVAEALETLESIKAALIDLKAQPIQVAYVIRAEAWLYISQDKPEQARALIEKAMAKEMKGEPRPFQADLAWALLFAGDSASAGQLMRVAAYAPPPQPNFLQNALGVKKKPRLTQPLDLAYFMIKENRTAEAAELIAKEAPWACRNRPAQRHGFYEPRDHAILAAYEAVCPSGKKGREARG
jgi:Zn-dependent protease